jgi:hypothetical protein
MRPLLFVVCLGCGGERAPEPVVPADKPVPVALQIDAAAPPSASEKLIGDFSAVRKGRSLGAATTAVAPQ